MTCPDCGSDMTIKERDKKLKPFSSVIQVCPRCEKIDVSLNDNHDCDPYRGIGVEEEDE